MVSIGGGYAALPLIQSQVVNQYQWLTMGEFTDLITIAEMTPGPIAVNSATFVGIRIAGIPGALIATFGCILPPASSCPFSPSSITGIKKCPPCKACWAASVRQWWR